MALSVDIFARWITLTSGPIQVRNRNLRRFDISSPICILHSEKPIVIEVKTMVKHYKCVIVKCGFIITHSLTGCIRRHDRYQRIGSWRFQSRCRVSSKWSWDRQTWRSPWCDKNIIFLIVLFFKFQFHFPYHSVSVRSDRTSSYASRIVSLSMLVRWAIWNRNKYHVIIHWIWIIKLI